MIGAEAATERIAENFTRPMRAATSRYGVLTDPPVMCAQVAVVVLLSVILYNLDVINRPQLPLVYGAIALPILGAFAVHFALRSARAKVIAWLAGLPFVVDNVNALLNGVAQHLVVRFAGDAPTRQALSDRLDTIHPDCFALEFHADEPEIALVIGLPESKINPAGANHRRYLRVRRMVDEALVDISKTYAIASVRVA